MEKPISKKMVGWNDKIKADALERNMYWYLRNLRGESITKLAAEYGVSISSMSRKVKSVRVK